MKDPAFLFYPGDWISGTMGMTFEEKGAYMELLMMQFNRGHMTIHMIGQVVGQLWERLQDKFVQDANGLWYNVRLELEKEKRAAFTATRRNNLSGTNQHTTESGHMNGQVKGHMTSHTDGRMENRNEDVNKNGDGGSVKGKEPEDQKFEIPTVEEIKIHFLKNNSSVLEAEKFFDFYESNGWKVGKNKMKKWKSAAGGWIKRNQPTNGQVVVDNPEQYPNYDNRLHPLENYAHSLVEGTWIYKLKMVGG